MSVAESAIINLKRSEIYEKKSNQMDSIDSVSGGYLYVFKCVCNRDCMLPRPKILTVTPTPTVKPTQTPISTPEPVPTQKPTSTPIPDTAEKDVSDPADQGTLSRPDHPDTISADKLVFIGDSRTEGLRDAVRDDSVWSCLSSMGYDWMVSTGVPQVEDQIEDNTAVIILMGVNDLYHVNDYISYINSKAAEWGNRGAQTYFVSVGPVQNDPYCTNGEIESFNAAMQANLSGATYIDVYSHLVSEGFSTVDGIHYPDSVSIDIYNYILDHLEEQRSGIWG